MTVTLTRQQALKLLRKYNKEEFHILHGLTVEGVMRWYAKEQGRTLQEGPKTFAGGGSVPGDDPVHMQPRLRVVQRCEAGA